MMPVFQHAAHFEYHKLYTQSFFCRRWRQGWCLSKVVISEQHPNESA